MKLPACTGLCGLFAAISSLATAQVYSVGTLAGLGGTPGYLDGTGSAARFNGPSAVAIDGAGNVFVGEANNAKLRKIAPGGAVTTLATLANGTAALVLDGAGGVYLADAASHAIRRVASDGTIALFAGQPGTPGNADGTGSAARFNSPQGLARDTGGNLYVADTGNHTLRKITPAGVVTTLAGLAGVSGSVDGPGPLARFFAPIGIAVDAAGNVYIGDGYNRTLRKIAPAGEVTTLAGLAGYSGTADGTGSAARFGMVQGLAVDAGGTLYATDSSYHTIRKITTAGAVTTVAGAPGAFGTADGLDGSARFGGPQGIALDAAGNFYVADTANHIVRKGTFIPLPTIATQPAAATVATGQNATFTVVANGTGTLTYQWQRQAAGTSGFVTLTNTGSYSGATTATLAVSAATVAMSGDQFRCVIGSAAGPATTNAATLTVMAPPAFTNAASTVFYVGQTGTFTFAATGSPAPTFSVTAGTLPAWANLNATSGALTGTPPNTTGTPFSFTVTATNGSGTASQAFTLNVQPAPVPPTIASTSAPRLLVSSGGSLTLNVTATGSTPFTYQWKRNGLPVAGATSASYTINGATVRDGGCYLVSVTNAGGSVTSAPIFVAVTYGTTQVVGWGPSLSVPSGLTSVVAISAGYGHNLALKSDGTVVGWGANDYGQTTIPSGLTGVVAIAAGGYHSLALKSDGTVIAWGNNSSGQTTVPSSLANVVAITAGQNHSVALKSDGTVVAWGSNGSNQSTVPAGLSGVIALAAASDHTLALKADGTVTAWGYLYSSVPASLGGAVAIAANSYVDIALKADGTVTAWGDTYYVGSAPSGLSGAVSVALSYYQAVALKADGTLVTWGSAYYDTVTTPIGLRSVGAISAGYTQRLALRDASNDTAPSITATPSSVAANLGQGVTFSVTATAGTASLNYQWLKDGTAITGATSSSYTINGVAAASAGSYSVTVSNSLGSVTSSAATLTVNASPVVSATNSGRYPLTVGQSLTLALASSISSSATVQWRRNGVAISGATGRSYTIASATLSQGGWYQAVYNEGSGPVISGAIFVPVVPAATQVVAWGDNSYYGTTSVPGGLTNVVSLAARGSSVVAVKADGTVSRWGYYSSSTLPSGLGNVVAVAVGSGSFYLALRADGTVVTWGDSYTTPPTLPANLSNVVAVAAGSQHALALKGDGTVVAWGAANYGATAVPAGLNNVVAIAAAGNFSLALRADGTVVGWGQNQYGESVPPAGLGGVVAIAAGSSFSVALKNDGTVVAWGYNGSGQTAVPAGLANVVAVAVGDSHAVALKGDGTVVAWGTTYYGVTNVPATLRNVVGIAADTYNSFALRDATGDTAPVIATQPASVTAFTGQSVTLRVSASVGTAQLAYQWRKAGVAIAGATNPSLLLSAVTAAQADDYDVVVANYLGSVISQPATLTVNATPGATTDITGRRVLSAGQSLTLTGSTPLTGSVTYQWRRNGQPIPGATNASYAISNATWTSGGAYQFVASNNVGPAASAPVYVVVQVGAQVRAWGSNSYGETTVPSPLADVFAVAAGYYHSLALKSDGTVVAWGRNDTGQCSVPSGMTNVIAIAAGSGFSMALSGDGTVTTWGSVNFTPAAAAGALAIAASGTSSLALALRPDGSVVAWDYSGLRTDVPAGLGGVVAIASGNFGQLAVKSDGTVVQWGGYYASGSPVPDGLANVVAVSSGYDHALALKSDGTVVAWGNNYSGQATVPSGLTGVVALAAGNGVSFALKGDGSVVAWGASYSSSVLVTGAAAINPALAIGAGYNHAIGLRDPSHDAAPVIASISPSQTVTAGQSVTLSVTANATPTPTYQWYRNGLALSGATSSSLAFTSVTTSNAGTYTVTVSNALGAVTSGEVVLTVNPTLAQRGLLASAARAETGVAISGTFTIEGATSKPMLVRAIGPALTAFGATGVLADPQLTITSASGALVATNDDWGSAANASSIASVSAQVGAFALSAGGKDAAILRTFAPGTYHARVTAGGTSTGVAMLEIYDADSTPRTVYIATNAYAGTGSKVFVQGFVVAGAPAGRSYLIRALGPSLGAAGALPDPTLAIFDSTDAQIAANDNWGGDSALASLAASVGAMPLASTSKDAALNFTPAAAGAYTIRVGDATGATGSVLVEIFEADSQRATAVAPAIVAQPQAATVLPGSAVTFGVLSVGRPAPAVQWRKGGATISGATNALLSIASAQAADAADYSVVVTNDGGSVTSAPAALAVVTQIATQGVVGHGYFAGATVTITNTFSYAGTASGLGWQVALPTGWSYASGGGAEGDVHPAAGATGTLEWAWSTPPASPFTFTYTLNVPAGETGAKAIAATAIVRAGGATQSSAAAPNPFTLGPAPVMHSADTDHDGKLNLAELLRVIELYNYRSGTLRTGQYTAAASSEDGFTPGPGGAALTVFHTADTNHDGKINLLELLRVIELYNYRSGTSRTGQYHAQAGTEDGFATGP